MIDIGQSPQHAWSETYCPSCGVPESAGLGQHGDDCPVAAIDAIPADDAKHARGALEDILLELVPGEVRRAAVELVKRCGGWLDSNERVAATLREVALSVPRGPVPDPADYLRECADLIDPAGAS